jgi:diadenosine tetraphosphatase ApaH/serine/threonine PP2A family protein phosphatase
LSLLALLADIHANREALDACLADAQTRGAMQCVFLGDLVGYGADPAYVIDLVRRKHSEGAIVIQGNHDAAIAEDSGSMNGSARAAIDWTRGKLDKDQRAFLAALPLTVERDDFLLVHADASAPARWIYVTNAFEAQRAMRATPKPLTICGHIHRPQLYRSSVFGPPKAETPTANIPIAIEGRRKWLAVVGAVGQPRDGNPTAAYALYDTASRKLTFRRVPYDIDTAAGKIRAAGLPDVLATRLFAGL